MAKPNLLNTSTINLRTLLANGKQYEVPPYQRDYSWKEEHWEDLWLDLEGLEKGQPQHYMGTLVLQEEEKPDRFKIIDGQQRFATLSLLVIASLHCLQEFIDAEVEAEDNKKRFELLRIAFLGAQDPVTLRTSPKLTLNQANRRFFEGTLLQMRKPASVSALPATERPLWDAQEYFRARLRERFFASKDGAGLATFVYEIVATRLLFIQVIVEDELSAYTVFETLNARGLELTASDLLKNYLFSLVHPTGTGNLNHVQTQWETIAARIETRSIPEFLRHFLNSRQAFVRQERVFKTIKTLVQTPDQVFALLDSLEHASVMYEALSDASHPLWNEIPDSTTSIRHLLLYRVAQYKPLVLAAWRKLSPEEMTTVLRICDVLSLRYNMISQRNTNKLEEVYNRVAVGINEGNLTDATAVRNAVLEVYISDDEFREAFARSILPASGSKKRLVRYILCAIEKQLHGYDWDFETTPASIEHILPESPNPSWETDFPGDLHERYVSRIGNYLLLESKLNSQGAGNADLATKKQVYSKSQYPSTRAFDWDEWTPRSIDQRQAAMARAATAIWRL